MSKSIESEDIKIRSDNDNYYINRDLALSLNEEYKAVQDYTRRAQLARKMNREDIAEMYDHIRKEEEEHLKEILNKLSTN